MVPDRPPGEDPTREELSARISSGSPDRALAGYARMTPDDRLQVADIAVDRIVLGSVRLVDRPPEDVDRSSPAPVAVLVEHPPDSLRAVVDHGAGPLDADTIRAASGQAVGRATPLP